MAAAARNDAAPVFGVLFERISLERVDLIADDASDRHGCSPQQSHRRTACDDDSNRFTAAYLRRLHTDIMPVAGQQHFVYHQSMNVENDVDAAVASIAAAIGEPARARMLYCLVDGHARTSTELAIVAE